MVKRNWSANHNQSYRQTQTMRCVICNSVNRAEVAQETGDHYHYGYHEIESYGESGAPAFVCHECQGWHHDVQTEWDIEDQLEEEDEPEM